MEKIMPPTKKGRCGGLSAAFVNLPMPVMQEYKSILQEKTENLQDAEESSASATAPPGTGVLAPLSPRCPYRKAKIKTSHPTTG